MRPGKLRYSIFQKVAGAGMSPAYVDMMIRSLLENGFLVAIGPRHCEMTRKGIELLEGQITGKHMDYGHDVWKG